ncbi:MAG TPA: alpha-amylase family glycosyl hydrolase, partial [Methylibium sp.]
HSAGRRGFGNADVILNLMPDRFANGNPANDDVPGFADKANRADNDAGRHGGDIQGIVDHLDHIAAMGYTMLWPTPLTESNQPHYSYHGYAATDTYRIDPRYGSNEDYRRMVAAARERGIGVIQDIVLNHIGSNHWWMRDLPTQDWVSGGSHYVPTGHARTAISDPYAAEVDRESFIAGWFGPEMPDMNQRNPLLATYQIQNTIWWIEYAGLAGIRADTYGYSDKHFLAQWSGRVMLEYPRLNIVGEEWSNNPVVTSYWLRGKKNADGYVSNLPSVMDFPLQATLLRALVAPEGLHSGLVDVYEAMVNDRLYPDPMNLVLFEGNHDLPRLYSMVDEDLALWKMALAFVLTAPRIPQIYVGTEILMTSPKVRDDGAFRHDFPGGWAGDKVNAFTGEGLSDRQKEAQAWLKRVLNWRKTQPAVHRGKFMHYQPQDGMYVYFRYDAKGLVMVVLNKNAGDATLATERFRQVLPQGASGTDVLTGRHYELGDTLVVPARSVLILDLKRPG